MTPQEEKDLNNLIVARVGKAVESVTQLSESNEQTATMMVGVIISAIETLAEHLHETTSPRMPLVFCRIKILMYAAQQLGVQTSAVSEEQVELYRKAGLLNESR